jgi:hypothetical protein
MNHTNFTIIEGALKTALSALDKAACAGNVNPHSQEELLTAAQKTEQAAILLREEICVLLRNEIGFRQHDYPMERNLIPVSVEMTQEGWLCISLPVMLPKRKEGDRARFLELPLRDAILRFRKANALPHFQTCVIVYEHIYEESTPRRRVTDHDNIELKHCQDVLETAFLTNDSAILCSVFQCSHMGKSSGTRIWILAPDQFSMWLGSHQTYWKDSR